MCDNTVECATKLYVKELCVCVCGCVCVCVTQACVTKAASPVP